MVINDNIKYTPEKSEKCTSYNKIKKQKKDHPPQSREYTKTDRLVKNEIRHDKLNKLNDLTKNQHYNSDKFDKEKTQLSNHTNKEPRNESNKNPLGKTTNTINSNANPIIQTTIPTELNTQPLKKHYIKF